MASVATEMTAGSMNAFRGNYFAEAHYTKANVSTGVINNRAGTRLCVLTNDFMLGFRKALIHECGPASDLVFHQCGRQWGEKFGARLAEELSNFYEQPLQEFPMPLFETCLAEAFAHHGLGRLTMDATQGNVGLIVFTFRNAMYAGMLKEAMETHGHLDGQPIDAPVDGLIAGIIAGLFRSFSKQPLDCIQTDCAARGADLSRFVLTSESRAEKARGWVEEGKSHDEILSMLAEVRG